MRIGPASSVKCREIIFKTKVLGRNENVEIEREIESVPLTLYVQLNGGHRLSVRPVRVLGLADQVTAMHLLRYVERERTAHLVDLLIGEELHVELRLFGQIDSRHKPMRSVLRRGPGQLQAVHRDQVLLLQRQATAGRRYVSVGGFKLRALLICIR